MQRNMMLAVPAVVATERIIIKVWVMQATEFVMLIQKMADVFRLLKILLTNFCIFDCAYCVSRKSNDIKRAAFTVQEVVDLND